MTAWLAAWLAGCKGKGKGQGQSQSQEADTAKMLIQPISRLIQPSGKLIQPKKLTANRLIQPSCRLIQPKRLIRLHVQSTIPGKCECRLCYGAQCAKKLIQLQRLIQPKRLIQPRGCYNRLATNSCGFD